MAVQRSLMEARISRNLSGKPHSHGCVCHVCGAFHVRMSTFLATSSVEIGGHRFLMTACPDCLANNTGGIKVAWKNGMSAQAQTRAEKETRHVIPCPCGAWFRLTAAQIAVWGAQSRGNVEDPLCPDCQAKLALDPTPFPGWQAQDAYERGWVWFDEEAANDEVLARRALKA